MADISYYWQNKSLRALQANQHTEIMAHQHPEEIEDSLVNSLIYSPIDTFFINPVDKDIPIFLAAKDSVSAIFDYYDGKTAVLNFASYKNPGGKFMEGSQAQEECLCHDSTLYPVLEHFTAGYYEENRKDTKNFMYQNRCLYSPRILFFGSWGPHPRNVECDVITCASPNWSGCQKYSKNPVTEAKNLEVLQDRCEFILRVAADQQVDNLILGAFGCGVFGQDPIIVASMFMTMLYKGQFKNVFKNVIFAVPASVNSQNYNAFVNVYNRYNK